MLSGMTKPKPKPPVNPDRYDPYKSYRFAEAPVEAGSAKTKKKAAKKSPKKK
jgi:hypothetical protein